MQIRDALATFKSRLPTIEEIKGPNALPMFELTSKHEWNPSMYYTSDDVFANHPDILVNACKLDQDTMVDPNYNAKVKLAITEAGHTLIAPIAEAEDISAETGEVNSDRTFHRHPVDPPLPPKGARIHKGRKPAPKQPRVRFHTRTGPGLKYARETNDPYAEFVDSKPGTADEWDIYHGNTYTTRVSQDDEVDDLRFYDASDNMDTITGHVIHLRLDPSKVDRPPDDRADFLINSHGP
jgi:hypothetical protein